MSLDRASVRRIAVFRALFLGDLLCAVPALRALRAGFPTAEIIFIGLPWAGDLLRRYSHYVDRFVEFPGYPGIHELPADPDRLTQFLAEQRTYSYDIVVQMHGSGSASNPFALALGGRVTVGYYVDTPPAGLTLGAVYPEHLPEVRRNLGLARLLDCPTADETLEFPLTAADYAEADALLAEAATAAPPWARDRSNRAAVQRNLGVDGHRPLVGLHAGASAPSRRWPADYFAAVADYFAERWGAVIVLTGGPSEHATVRAVRERMENPALDLTGRTGLGGLAAVIDRLDLFITNDTGPAHVANAVGTPSVTLFGPIDSTRWAALDQDVHPIARLAVDCSPCDLAECPIDHRCLTWLTPDRIIRLAERLLTTRIVCNA